MRNIKIVLEYDGSKFCGFQKQPKRVTVQGCLEKSMSKLFNRPVKIKAASGRTDAGVHARHQVVNFKVDSKLKLYQIQRGLNRYLPPEVSVMMAKEESEDFNARFGAKTKIYEYRVWNGPVRSPLEAATSHHVMARLDLSVMRQAAKLLTGKLDFASFCGTDAKRGKAAFFENEKNTVRTIKRFEIRKKGPLFRFIIEGDGFLNHMVRNIVGTLLDIGRGRLALQELSGILKQRDRKRAGMSVPACGLTLISVTY